MNMSFNLNKTHGACTLRTNNSWFVSLIGLLLVFGFSQTAMAQSVDTTWSAPSFADTLHNPVIDNHQAIKDGQHIFERMCVVCHGKKGDGKGLASTTLEPSPADFLAIRVRDESDGAIFWKITEGKAPMASYKTLLSERQRWLLVKYIRTLERKFK